MKRIFLAHDGFYMVRDYETDSTVLRDSNWIFVAEFIRANPDTYNVDDSVKPQAPDWYSITAANEKKRNEL